VNADQYARLMQLRARRIEPEFRHTTRGIANSVLEFSRQRMHALIYAFPVPRRKSGKPAYKRTGDLLAGERQVPAGPYSFRIVNDVPYAEPRHEAGKPGRRKVRHPAHWRDELIARSHSILVDNHRKTARKILGLKGGG
jgi:hypothetical protein